jgi:hypothetical protein
MPTRVKLYLYIIATSLAIALGAGIAIGAIALAPALVAGSATAAPAVDAEAEYHRGLYDICRALLSGSRDQCMQAVVEARANHWYEQSSEGWSWADAAQASQQ